MPESCVTCTARLPSGAVTHTLALSPSRWTTASLVPSGDQAWAVSRPSVKRVTRRRGRGALVLR